MPPYRSNTCCQPWKHLVRGRLVCPIPSTTHIDSDPQSSASCLRSRNSCPTALETYISPPDLFEWFEGRRSLREYRTIAFGVASAPVIWELECTAATTAT